MPTKTAETNPRNIWGKVVFYLRQNNHSALHVICGSIDDTDIIEQTFVVRTYDNYVYSHLTEKINLAVLKRALVWQDLPIDIKIELVTKQADKQEQDIKKLKNLVGDQLIVIGE